MELPLLSINLHIGKIETSQVRTRKPINVEPLWFPFAHNEIEAKGASNAKVLEAKRRDSTILNTAVVSSHCYALVTGAVAQFPCEPTVEPMTSRLTASTLGCLYAV